MLMFVILVLGLGAIVVLAAVAMYNGLVRMREQVDASWSNIDVELKRRHDLIPNLVETVKGYATHEKSTLEGVIRARNAAISANGPAETAAAENALSGALRQIFALSEAYPDLKANQNFLQLQGQLSQVEDQIQRARSAYNAGVRDYNTKTRQVPTNLIATAFGFDAREFFEIEEEARAAPQVKF
jgi:LemA protein